MVQKAEVITNTSYKEYYGTSEEDFKSRYNNHAQSFRHISHINGKELSKYLWGLKVNGTDYHLKCSIKSCASPYKCSARRCGLCLTEKLGYCSSRPKNSIEQKNWTDIKMSL